MPLLPNEYKEVSPEVYYPAICPHCEKEVAGPYKTGRSIVGVHQAVYLCGDCLTRFAIRYSPKTPKSQFLVELLVPEKSKFQPARMRLYLLYDKAQRERPASVVLPVPPDNSASPDNQD